MRWWNALLRRGPAGASPAATPPRQDAVRPDRPPHDPAIVDRLDDVMRFPVEDWPTLYSPESLRSLRAALRFVDRVVRHAVARGASPCARLQDEGSARRAVLHDAIGAVIAANAAVERTIRAAAWALDAGPGHAPVGVFAARDLQRRDGGPGATPLPRALDGALVAWLSDPDPSAGAARALEQSGATLLVDDTCGNASSPVDGCTWRCLNGARVVRDGRQSMVLPGAAGLAQAALRRRRVGAWWAVRAPAGFDALVPEFDLDSLRWASTGRRTALVREHGRSARLLVHRDFPPERAGAAHSVHTGASQPHTSQEGQLTMTSMPKKEKGQTIVFYEQGKPLASTEVLGKVLLGLDLEGLGTRTRDASTLRSALRIEQVHDTPELCRAFDVRIRGRVKDLDGSTVEVDVPVADESTFSFAGLVGADPWFHELYVQSKTADQMARLFAESGRDGLTDGELERLHHYLDFLDKVEQAEVKR